MATKMTPTDADLHALLNPPHGFDEAAERRQWKLYEAARQIVAEAGKKLRDVLPDGDGKALVFEELGDLVNYIRHAVQAWPGNAAGPAEPVAPPVPADPPVEVPPVAPPDPPPEHHPV